MYVCAYIYVCIYVYICAHVCTSVYKCVYVCMCVHIYVYVYVYVDTNVDVYLWYKKHHGQLCPDHENLAKKQETTTDVQTISEQQELMVFPSFGVVWSS